MSNYTKYINAYYDLAEKCLDKRWGLERGPFGYERGWDKGSPAHAFTLRWIQNNYKRFKKMLFKDIYKEYLIACRED